MCVCVSMGACVEVTRQAPMSVHAFHLVVCGSVSVICCSAQNPGPNYRDSPVCLSSSLCDHCGYRPVLCPQLLHRLRSELRSSCLHGNIFPLCNTPALNDSLISFIHITNEAILQSMKLLKNCFIVTLL